MKKSNLLFILLGFVATSFLASCDTIVDGEVEAPLLTLVPSSDVTAIEGESVTIEVIAGQNPTSTSKLQELDVDYAGTAEDTTVDLNSETFTAMFSFTAPTAGQSDVVTFTLTDKAGVVTTKTITITGEALVTANPINTYSATMIGSHTNATLGSAFASSNGQVYLKADAAADSDLIDFVYYFGSSNEASIAAPDEETVDGTASNSVDLTNTYPTKNATRFMATSISAADFSAMTDDENFPVFSGSSSLQNMLNAGDVFAFQTVENKVGLVLVSSISSGADGTITIDVKVQQ